MPADTTQASKNYRSRDANPSATAPECDKAAGDFSCLVTPHWMEKARRSEQPQALLRQVMPSAEELESVPGYTRDPLKERSGDPGDLIEKYPGRLLLMVTRSCSAHCRFCFRRHALDTPVHQGRLQAAFRQRMEAGDDISEVILSGGDPLVLSERRLAAWFEFIQQFPQVRRIRIHTREPVFSPQRITPGLAGLIRRSAVPVIVAVHVNHAHELDEETVQALDRLREAGATMLSQTVLLRGVNDSVETLTALFERAVESGLTPYYLHQLDRVSGAAHFAVERERGLEIVRSLKQALPGYMVPRYVEEVPGDASKRPIAPGD